MAEKNSTLLTNIALGRLAVPAIYGSGKTFVARANAAVLAADADGDIYRLFSVPSNAVPIRIQIRTTAITAGTDYDLGLYTTGASGAVKDKDVFVDGQTMATAATLFLPSTALITDVNKAFWELAGDTADTGKVYDVCLTANTVGSADGTIWVFLEYMI